MTVRQSATLAVNERMHALRAQGKNVLHLAFGEAGLPVLPELADVLAHSTRHNDYGPVTGIRAAREAAADWFARRGLPTDPDQIVFGPGSKSMLYALLAALPGDVVLPAPSWLTYAAQASLVGKRTIGVPIPVRAGGVPHPGLLPGALAAARADGLTPGILILTLPDNPTGTVAPRSLLAEVCQIADREGLVVISDEIYRDLAHRPDEFVSTAELLPERTFVTGGLSKNLALGGYRIGFTRLPDPRLLPALVGVCSEVWSSLAGPMQRVAAAALAEPPEVMARIDASRRLHATVTRAVHDILLDAGAKCRPPEGAFYLYPDFGGLGLDARTGPELTEMLLERHGIGVLAGAEFGDDRHALRFRLATSLLYGGADEQRLASLHSARPLELPWISAALTQLRDSLARLG